MEAVNIKNVQQLIAEVNRINHHQKEIKKLRGEHFNIFSILQMEHKENATHSAFLGELLSPNGSHFLNSIFLKLFLLEIDYDGLLDVSTARVQLEKHLGKVNLNNKTGGRIDIYISDSSGNSISIENKIYAPDQVAQIERYFNHNIGKNSVYYLTLNGKMPDNESVGDLVEGNQYNCISYQQTIIKWLTLCMKEAAEQPILRESIKQYILLIKKLTNQLSDNNMENQVLESIKKNYQSAKIIADNIWKVELDATEVFLTELLEELNTKLGNEYKIVMDDDLTQTWSGFSIFHEDWNGISIRLEGQSKVPWNDSIYGIYANSNKWMRDDIINEFSKLNEFKSELKNNRHWPYYNTILRFSKVDEKEKLFNVSSRKMLVKDTSKKLIQLVNLCIVPLSKVRKLNKS